MVAEREFVTESACTLRLPVRLAETLTAKNRTQQHELHPLDRTVQWTTPIGRTFNSDPATTIRAPRHKPKNPEKKERRQDPDEPAPF